MGPFLPPGPGGIGKVASLLHGSVCKWETQGDGGRGWERRVGDGVEQWGMSAMSPKVLKLWDPIYFFA